MAQWGVTEAKVGSHRVVLVQAGILLACALTTFSVRADEPKPTPENTIHVQLAAPVPPQKFAKPPKFFISEVIDRSGNPQPMLVLKDRGGMFLDRLPTQIRGVAADPSGGHIDRECGHAEKERPEKCASQRRRGARGCGEESFARDAIARSGGDAHEKQPECPGSGSRRWHGICPWRRERRPELQVQISGEVTKCVY